MIALYSLLSMIIICWTYFEALRMFSPHYQPALTAFPSDYHAARAAFLQALRLPVCALQHEPILYPALDPQANALYTDVAWLGNPQAEKVLILISATHGVGNCRFGDSNRCFAAISATNLARQ